MKKLSNDLAKRYYQMIEDIINSKNYGDLRCAHGVCLGFASALFVADIIDLECYNGMTELALKTAERRVDKGLSID